MRRFLEGQPVVLWPRVSGARLSTRVRLTKIDAENFRHQQTLGASGTEHDAESGSFALRLRFTRYTASWGDILAASHVVRERSQPNHELASILARPASIPSCLLLVFEKDLRHAFRPCIVAS